MRVVAFNGSPKKDGNTYHALKMVAEELEREIQFPSFVDGNCVYKDSELIIYMAKSYR